MSSVLGRRCAVGGRLLAGDSVVLGEMQKVHSKESLRMLDVRRHRGTVCLRVSDASRLAFSEVFA